MSTVSELIRGLRAKGLSQSEISRRTKIPQPRISRWERGEAPESVDDALRLAELHASMSEQLAARPTCKELRTDVRSHRVPDDGWPHPAGPPLIDVATSTDEPQAAAASTMETRDAA